MLPTLKLHKPSEADWIKEVIDDSDTIWLDFEQPQNAPHPTLVGALCDGEFEQVVFDPLLEQAVGAKIKSDLPIRVEVWEDWLLEIYDHVEEGCSLVGYSEHELNVLTMGWQSVGIGEIVNEDAAYLDANVARLLRRNHPDLRDEIVRQRTENGIFQPDKVGLKDILYHPDIPFQYPTYLRTFQVGQAIREFQDQQEKKGRYKDWASGSKTKWAQLLTYNRLDVEGMQFITKYAWENWRD